MKSITPSAQRRQCANIGVGVLIFLSVCLCGLVAFQWVVQSRLRELVETERTEKNRLLGERQDLENKARRYADEISHITELRTRLEEEKKTNLVELGKTANELTRLRNDYNSASNLTLAYSNNLVRANTNLVLQNERLAELTAGARKAMEDRNEVVGKFNEMAKKYTDLVTNYNALVKQFEDYQKQVQEMLEKQKEAKK